MHDVDYVVLCTFANNLRLWGRHSLTVDKTSCISVIEFFSSTLSWLLNLKYNKTGISSFFLKRKQNLVLFYWNGFRTSFIIKLPWKIKKLVIKSLRRYIPFDMSKKLNGKYILEKISIFSTSLLLGGNIGESINADFYKRYKRYDKHDLG